MSEVLTLFLLIQVGAMGFVELRLRYWTKELERQKARGAELDTEMKRLEIRSEILDELFEQVAEFNDRG